MSKLIQSATLGYVPAMQDIARNYRKGIALTVDEAKAKRWDAIAEAALIEKPDMF